MNVLITEELSHATPGITIAATCGKVSGVVSVSKHGLDVLCVNASHRVWRRGGRWFRDKNAAFEHYRSPEMRAIIETALGKAAL